MEYELVHEIKNLCRNNQMRDVFFKEIETDDPVAYVRSIEKDGELQVTVNPDGEIVVSLDVGAKQIKYSFTED